MEKVKNKIEEAELLTIQEHQKQSAGILHEVGLLEAQKHSKLHEIAGLNEVVNKFKKQLEEKYGSININIEDGSYELIETPTEDV